MTPAREKDALIAHRVFGKKLKLINEEFRIDDGTRWGLPISLYSSHILAALGLVETLQQRAEMDADGAARWQRFVGIIEKHHQRSINNLLTHWMKLPGVIADAALAVYPAEEGTPK